FTEEEDNLRAMLDRLTEETIADATRAAWLLNLYWFAHGSYAEERQRLRALLARDDLPNPSRGALLSILTFIELAAGDLKAQEAAAREALPLTEPGTYDHTNTLIALGLVAVRSGRPDDAVGFARQIQEDAQDSSSSLTGPQRIEVRANAAHIFGEAGDTQTARTLMHEVLIENRGIGNEYGEAAAAVTLPEFDLYEHDYQAAHDGFVAMLATARRVTSSMMETDVLRGLGYALLGLEQRSEARAAFLELVDLALEDSPRPTLPLADALDGIALATNPSDTHPAARLRAATASIRHAANLVSPPKVTELEQHFEQPLIDPLGQGAWDREQAVGAKMTLEETIELARSLAAGPE